MTATPEQLNRLQAVNAEINEIPYDANTEADSEDLWVDAPAPGTGWECRMYTIAKAKALREAGWPVDDMGVVLCYDELGEYHAVLGCNATGDIYILDNRYPTIYLWTSPPYAYKWAHQQIPGSVEFRDATSGLV